MTFIIKLLSLVAFLFVLGGCKNERRDLNVRISVYVQSDGETTVFSENYSIAIYIRPKILRSFDGASIYPSTTGEAIVVQIGDNMFFASDMDGGSHPGGALERAHISLFLKTTRGIGYEAWFDVAPGLTEETDVPREYWPDFYAFENPQDPNTAYTFAPEDLTGWTIDRVTVQATSLEPEVDDVVLALPWIAQLAGGALCPEYLEEWRAGGPKLPCLSIVKGNLIMVPKAS